MTSPPQSEEAELGVLGAMLESRQSIERALDVLEPNGEQKFYRPSHGRVYAAVRSLLEQAPNPWPVQPGWWWQVDDPVDPLPVERVASMLEERAA